jgi:hypothetical protein
VSALAGQVAPATITVGSEAKASIALAEYSYEALDGARPTARARARPCGPQRSAGPRRHSRGGAPAEAASRGTGTKTVLEEHFEVSAGSELSGTERFSWASFDGAAPLPLLPPPPRRAAAQSTAPHGAPDVLLRRGVWASRQVRVLGGACDRRGAGGV